MGMTASQARLLSITARLSDNEHAGQSVSYTKQRLADQTDRIQQEYNAALSATKLTVLTGFVGSAPQYTDISYGLMTGIEMAQNTRQYVITDAKGKVLVSQQLANAFTGAQGDYNRFLANLGYSQSDLGGVNVNAKTSNPTVAAAAEQKIHDAWDKYFVSVNKGYGDNDVHDFRIGLKPTGTGVSYPYMQLVQAYDYEQLYKDEETGRYLSEKELKALYEDEGLDLAQILDKTWSSPIYDATANDGLGGVVDNDNGVKYSAVYISADGTPTTTKTIWEDATTGDKFYSKTDTRPDEAPGTATKTTNDALYARIPNEKSLDECDPVVAGDPKYTQNPSTGGWSRTGAYTETDYGVGPGPITFDGTTQAQRELYDYAVAITQAYHDPLFNPDQPGGVKTASNPENLSTINYYQNIYNEMLANGFYTYGNAPAGYKGPDDVYLPFPSIDGSGIPNNPGGSTPRNTSPLADNHTFEKYLREGALQIKFFSTTERKFINTTINEDQGVQEVKDERKIALAEVKYQQDMRELERQDKILDIELKKLDTEHNTLQTEYDSVKGIISKNIEKTFSMFS